MSGFRGVFVIVIFSIFYCEIVANEQNSKVDSRKNSYHYNFETFDYTNLTFSHAESPVWDPDTNTLYWVDVLNQNVYALDYGTKELTVKYIDKGEVNAVIPIVGSQRLFIGLRTCVYILDWDKVDSSDVRFVTAVDDGSPDNVIYEAKADVRGRLWLGTKGPQHGDTILLDRAALYSLEQPNFEPRVQWKPVSISNGMVWSLNNSVLYFIDSVSTAIDAFDFDAGRGWISNRRTLLDLSKYNFMKNKPQPYPNGITIDREGFLWVTLMYGGSVIRIDPDQRKIVSKFKLPVSRTTSVTWAGETLEDLIVTTSNQDMDEKELKREPLSGAMFVLQQLGVGGVPTYKVSFNNADIF